MELSKQVCSLELSKRLKELGVKQESHFIWSEISSPETLWCVNAYENKYSYDTAPWYAAFTVAELHMLLPAGITFLRGRDGFSCQMGLFRQYSQISGSQEPEKWLKARGSFNYRSEADAAARMLIYLVENKLIHR
jgi:hypothetical protein